MPGTPPSDHPPAQSRADLTSLKPLEGVKDERPVSQAACPWAEEEGGKGGRGAPPGPGRLRTTQRHPWVEAKWGEHPHPPPPLCPHSHEHPRPAGLDSGDHHTR